MSSLSVSAYIRNGLEANKMTYRELSARSGVPISTLSAYARGQVTRPVADNLSRIVEAFGDGGDTLQALYADDDGNEADRGQVLADQIAEQTRGDFADALEVYAAKSEAQYRDRLAAVQEQYQEYLADAEQLYAERLDAEQRHHAQIIAEMREHAQTIDRRSEDARRYLKRLVRVLAVAVFVLMILLGMFAAYGVYAFNAFDRKDPNRGIYREEIHKEEK